MTECNDGMQRSGYVILTAHTPQYTLLMKCPFLGSKLEPLIATVSGDLRGPEGARRDLKAYQPLQAGIEPATWDPGSQAGCEDMYIYNTAMKTWRHW